VGLIVVVVRNGRVGMYPCPFGYIFYATTAFDASKSTQPIVRVAVAKRHPPGCAFTQVGGAVKQLHVGYGAPERIQVWVV